jgi:hypothetical protein
VALGDGQSLPPDRDATQRKPRFEAVDRHVWRQGPGEGGEPPPPPPDPSVRGLPPSGIRPGAPPAAAPAPPPGALGWPREPGEPGAPGWPGAPVAPPPDDGGAGWSNGENKSPARSLLTPSILFAYPQVISRCFASFRVAKFSIFAGQRDFRSLFDSRQIH